jgi:RNA 2',3'-cyclic 3'-phosphodiesterase
VLVTDGDAAARGAPEREQSRSRRLFFALWPDERMQAALAEATRAVVSACDGAAVPSQNFHLTLAFLGAVPEHRIADLTPIAARVALAYQAHAETAGAPLVIALDRIDYWRRSEILCATARAPSVPATALAGALRSALTEHGFAPDLKPFRTHATLARKVRRVTRERDMSAVRWMFRDFRLVESHTAPSGAVYSTREIYPLDASSR